MNRIVLCMVSAIIASSAVNAKNPRATLKLDYKSKAEWNYKFSYGSKCIFEQDNDKNVKNTKISFTINGKLAPDKEHIEMKVSNVKIRSSLYEEKVKKAIAGKLNETTYRLGLIDGCPVIDTALDLSEGGLPEWNLYMQLAKLIPELPAKRIKKGFSWERRALLPVETSGAKADCEVYRKFEVDRISKDADTAYISWKFRYATVEKIQDPRRLSHIPVSGNGSGTAVINLESGFILSASMQFDTPVAKVDNAKVNWKENATLTYEPGK